MSRQQKTLNEESYDELAEYISSHPDKTTFEGHVCFAPYKDKLWLRINSAMGTIYFMNRMASGCFYITPFRLDGPVVVRIQGDNMYRVPGMTLGLSKREFNKHPKVIEHHLGRIVDEVLSEED